MNKVYTVNVLPYFNFVNLAKSFMFSVPITPVEPCI